MASLRRKNLIASRRRVDDEGEEEGGPDVVELEDDSLSEGSVISDEDDVADGSEHSQVNTQTPDSPVLKKIESNGLVSSVNGDAKSSGKTAAATSEDFPQTVTNGINDTEMMLNGLNISDHNSVVEEVHYDDLQESLIGSESVEQPATNSSAQMDLPQETPLERRRREHEEYKTKRDADPAFVPNRGAFFMHDHRHAGPAANGFRPSGRGARGRGRAGIGGPFAPINFPQAAEPTDAPWTHDMHEVVLESDLPNPRRPIDPQNISNESTRGPSQAPRGQPLNRSLSTTRHIGNVQIRVFLHGMKEPIKLTSTPVNQYTRLPDHRPPLRRDKPVRISLPDHPPRYIFPAVERSFIFIPRAMRPNQQGFSSRNRGRSGLGSVSGFSRRTSVYGGSVYGSAYTPSVAMSRRSSLAYELPRENLISPTGSTMSRPPMHVDASRPVVRLPPAGQAMQLRPSQSSMAYEQQQAGIPAEASLSKDLPRPQSYPLPQKPYRENMPNAIPMHQPRPQKAVSVADIESPASLTFNPQQQYQQQPFHQQMPVQVNGNGFSHEPHLQPHSRNASYPSQTSTGTPLSQIPERAIHAQPFQPQVYQPPQGYYPPQYQLMPPQQGYYYPPQQFSAPMVPSAPAFVSAAPPPQAAYAPPTQPDAAAGAQQSGQSNLVAQEVNGMVYYYDASQIPAVATFPAYPAPQPYPMQQVNMGGMMTPSPDGFYYAQPPQGVVYYPQQ